MLDNCALDFMGGEERDDGDGRGEVDDEDERGSPRDLVAAGFEPDGIMRGGGPLEPLLTCIEVLDGGKGILVGVVNATPSSQSPPASQSSSSSASLALLLTPAPPPFG